MGKRDLPEFEQLVLLAVARIGPHAYGMVVRDEIGHRTHRAPSLAAVYATLNKLETLDLLSSWTAPSTARRGGRATRHFQLEREGARALKTSQDRMRHMWDGVELAPYLEQG